VSRLAEVEAKRSALLVRRAVIEGRLAALAAAQKQGRSPAELSALVAGQPVNGDTHVPSRTEAKADLQKELLGLLRQQETLLENYGPEHPEVIAVSKRIELTRKLVGSPAGPPDDARQRETVAAYIRSLRQELDDVH